MLGRESYADLLGSNRAPALTFHRVLPTGHAPYRVVWADGDTVYAVGRDRRLRKSVDGGANWSNRGSSTIGAFGYRDCFIVSTTGDLLALRKEGTLTRALYSTAASDGNAWTSAGTFTTNAIPLGSQSFCQDLNTGYVYFAEYYPSGTDSVPSVNVWRSTDDGRSFSVFHAFDGAGTGGANHIRHLHSIQYDPVSERVYILAGDQEQAAGIYRVNAAGDGIEPVVTNSMMPSGYQAQATAIGLMFFDDHIAWPADVLNVPAHLWRVPRTEIGQADPQVEQMFQINADGWWTIQSSDDRSMWLFCAANEGTAAVDSASHVYAVTDEGRTMWELGTLGTGGGLYGALAPVGPGGQRPWVSSRSFEANFSAQVEVASGTPDLLAGIAGAKRRLFDRVFTQASGLVTVPAGGSVVFGHARVPKVLSRFFAIEAGVVVSSGSGTLKVKVVQSTGGATVAGIDTDNSGVVANADQDGAPYYTAQSMTASEVLHFVVYESGGVNEATGTAFVSYAFGATSNGDAWDWDTI